MTLKSDMRLAPKAGNIQLSDERIVRARPLAHFVCALAILSAGAQVGLGDWPTYRADPTRVGNIDDRPGPVIPQVLWAHKSPEHFLASPVVGGDFLFVSGLGAFNTAAFHCLSLDDAPKQRVLWSKSAPYLKLPVVCAPAMASGLLVFGDGMHQTDGATLRCLRAENGRPLWEHPVPGKLVHLEGSPTIDKDRVYIGGGDAGVICVALNRVSLDGKEQDLSAAELTIEKRWADLTAKYEQDKQKDAQFAVPPSEDALPKPAPKLHWQQGKGAWHVDAPLAVVGGRVYAASAYIDDDKVGKRCLLCLDAANGKLVWEAPLKLNPWAGPTVAGNTVIVGCSSIRLEKKLLPEAKGEVVAFDLANGKVRWRMDVPGGVLSPVAVKGDTAVFAATDGKVRAVNADGGQPKWTYDAGAPLFAAPAVAGGMVYAADLKAVLHAIVLADGKPQWKLDVGGHPAVQLPGMVFGSPVVHGGQIYLATCNQEGDWIDQPCVVACVSDKSGMAAKAAPLFDLDKARRTVTILCKVAARKLPTLQEIYPLEVVATYPPPQGQKAHETVVTFEVKPSDVHKAMQELGLKPGVRASADGGPANGPEVTVMLELLGADGRPRLLPIERAMIDRRTGRPLPAVKWYFTGSALRQPNPEKDLKIYAADLSGTLITLFPVTDECVFQSNLTMKEGSLLKVETNKNLLPEEGATMKMIIQAK